MESTLFIQNNYHFTCLYICLYTCMRFHLKKGFSEETNLDLSEKLQLTPHTYKGSQEMTMNHKMTIHPKNVQPRRNG